MRFLRYFFVVLLLIFTGEVCNGQSWDWVAGNSTSWFYNPYITKGGSIYTTQNTYSKFFSSADTSKYKSEIITKIDKSGKRVCGAKIDMYVDEVNTYRYKEIFVHENKVYIYLFYNKELKIGSKYYPKPTGNSQKQNIFLIILDTNCVIQESYLLGWFSSGNISSIKLSPDNKFYLSLVLQNKDSIYLANRLFVGEKKPSSILVKFDESFNIIWNIVYNASTRHRCNFDKNGNYWAELFEIGQTKTRFIKINPQGVITDSIVFDGLIEVGSFVFDKDNNFLLTGNISGNVILPDGTTKSGLNRTGILLKYTNTGKYFWHRLASKPYSFFHNVVTDDSNNIYLSGDRLGGAIDNNSETFTFTGLSVYSSPYNIFFIKVDGNGTGIWANYLDFKNIKSRGLLLNIDNFNNLYFSGNFYFNQNSAATALIGKHSIIAVGNGWSNNFIAKLNPDKLEFDVKESCEVITLKNTSDTSAYTSFEWTLPDGTKHFSKDAYIETNKYKDTVLVSLKGIKPNGCENIFTRKLKFKPMPKPVAKFTIDSFTGCQWMGLKFYNRSYKVVKPNCIDCEGFRWDFGDGTTSNSSDSIIEHIYKTPGTYKISLIYATLPCSDTFTLEKEITIIAAPKPGFSVNLNASCSPLEVKVTDNSVGQVETYFYTSGDGQTSNQPSPTFIYAKPGKYFIKQQLKGPTECITKDSIAITIRAGYSQSAAPEMLTATVTDSNAIRVSWKKNDVTAKYQLIRQSSNGEKSFTLQDADTFFLDKDVDVNKAFYSYNLYGTDSCGNTKSAIRKAQTILLENHSQTTEYNYLRWSPYQNWQHGIKEYMLQYKTDSQFIDLQNLAGNTHEFKDAQSYPAGTKQICYRITAVENAGNMQQSHSNTVCMHFLPTVIVPNAFSPNNDGVNDVFDISALGIENYELIIYNRWGEKIYSGTEKEKGWDGNFRSSLAPEDVYLYRIIAKAYNGKNIYQNGNLQLLR